MKVALCKNTEWADATPNPASHHMESLKNYVRVSEYVDVEFIPRDNANVVEDQVAALEAAAAEINAKAHDAVANIKTRIMELRAIGHEVP
jgi:hypothetical protein